MLYLSHTAHWQFLGLLVGVVAWVLTVASTGLNEWRLWYVSDVSVVTSGVAWVGIWRACFYSHALPDAETCRGFGLLDGFAPPELAAAQVLMLLACACGLAGNVSAAAAVRLAYFSVERRGRMGAAFALAGALYLLTAALSAVPLLWNAAAVLGNQTIPFPPEFLLPAAPDSQGVGAAVAVGVTGSAMMLLSGGVFLCYRFVWRRPEDSKDPLTGAWQLTTLSQNPERPGKGVDNSAFQAEERL